MVLQTIIAITGLVIAVTGIIAVMISWYELKKKIGKVETIAAQDLHNTSELKQEINGRLTEFIKLINEKTLVDIAVAHSKGITEGIAIGRQQILETTQKQGLQGLQGLPGATGQQGTAGETGATGAKGQQGQRGEKGDEGNQGRRHLHDH